VAEIPCKNVRLVSRGCVEAYLSRASSEAKLQGFEETDVKLFLPLMTLVGAVTVLLTGAGGWSIGYL